jgi:hypothetical protein
MCRSKIFESLLIRLVQAGLSLLLVAGCATEISDDERGISQVQHQPHMGGYFDGKWLQVKGTDLPESGVPLEGVLYLPDGSIFQGSFLRGEPWKGKTRYPDGREVDEYNGTLNYRDGSQYSGTIVKGKAEGRGTMVFANGDSTTGTFKNGKPHGTALEVKGSEIFYGPFNNGLKDGIGYCSVNGVASTCSRKGDVDNLSQALRDRGAERARQKLKDEVTSAQEKIDNEFKDRLSQRKAVADTLTQRRKLLEGPNQHSDGTCYCALGGPCLTLIRNGETVDKKLAELESERRYLECREKYSEWLQIEKSPNFAQRKADLDKQIARERQRFDDELAEKARKKKAVEAEWARRAADQAMMERISRQEAAKEEMRLKEKLENEKAQCRKKAPVSLADCRCVALLNISVPRVPGKVGVCAA